MKRNITLAGRATARALLLSLVGLLHACDDVTAPQHLERARAFQAKGEVRAEIIELKNALQKDHELTEARRRLGLALVATRDGAGAEIQLERALDGDADNLELRLALVHAKLLQAHYKRALADLKKIKAELRSAEWHSLRGEAEFGLRHFEAATAAFEQALAQAPDDSRARLGLLRMALTQGDHARAESDLEPILKSEPNNLDAWLLKGKLASAGSDFVMAENAFQTALRIDGGSTAARTGLVEALMAQGKREKAEEQLAPVMAALPDPAEANYLKAQMAWHSDKPNAAKQALQAALEANAEHLPSLLLMAAVNFEEGQLREAREYLDRFLAQDKTHAGARQLLGIVHLQSGELQDGIRLLRPLADERPADTRLHTLLGSAYLDAGQTDEGMRYLKRASELAPDAELVRTQLALGYLATGATESAMSELESAAKLESESARAEALLIQLLLREKKFDRALERARGFVRDKPKEPMTHLLLGLALEGKGDLERARDAYEAALEANPEYFFAEANLARLDLRAGAVDVARGRFASIAKRTDNNAQVLLGLAQMAEQQGYVDEGLRLVRQAQEENPEVVEPYLLLVEYYLRTGQEPEALSIAQEAAAVKKDDPRVQIVLGRAQVAAGESKEGLVTLRGVTERYPQSADAYYQLGAAQIQTGDTNDARHSLTQALELQPTHLTAALALGDLELAAKNLDNALNVARKVQQSHPDVVAGYILHGNVLMARSQPREAAVAYQVALERSPDSKTVLRVYAAHNAAGDAGESRQVLEQWLREHPEDVAARLVLATAYQTSGETDTAIAEYTRVIEKEPKNLVALNNLAWLYTEQSNPRAVEIARRAFEQAPERADVMDTYGWALVQGGQVDVGLEILKEAAARTSNEPIIRYHLAAGLAKTGQKDQARQELEAILRNDQQFIGRSEAEALLGSLK